jgi:hypothetical protein
VSAAPESKAYASYDLAPRPLYLAGLVLALVVALALGIVLAVFRGMDAASARRQVPAHPLAEPTQAPPEPRLLEDPDRNWAEFAREQRERVEGYGWVDRENGVVRIPIERAMELVAEEGLPVR